MTIKPSLFLKQTYLQTMRLIAILFVILNSLSLSARNYLVVKDTTHNNYLVHITAYNERRETTDFNLPNVAIKEDNKGIWHYYLGTSYSTLEEADSAKRDLIKRGFPYTYIIDIEKVRRECKLQCDTDPSIDPAGTISMKKIRSVHHLLYEFNRYTLSNESKSMLQNLSRVLNENQYYSVELKGHADALGTPESNQEISEKRADLAALFLNSIGINPSRIKSSSYGMDQPIAKNTLNGKDCPKGRRYNRRVEIFITDKGGNVLNAIVEPFDIPTELALKSAKP